MLRRTTGHSSVRCVLQKFAVRRPLSLALGLMLSAAWADHCLADDLSPPEVSSASDSSAAAATDEPATQPVPEISAASRPAPAQAAADTIRTPMPPRLIGATAIVTEVSTGLPFVARVDTGAQSCSIHCESLEIEEPSENPQENIGKTVRFLVRNKKGGAEWLEATIADHITVRTSESEDWRYKVRLSLRWKDLEKDVLVTLNDRTKMTYSFLLGRNFLRGDFLVNVDSSHVE